MKLRSAHTGQCIRQLFYGTAMSKLFIPGEECQLQNSFPLLALRALPASRDVQLGPVRGLVGASKVVGAGGGGAGSVHAVLCQVQEIRDEED